MKNRILLMMVGMLCILMSGCQTPRSTIPVTTETEVSNTNNTQLLVERVQNLMNEIRVWEHRRDSINNSDSVIITDSVIILVDETGEMVTKERYREKVQKTDRASTVENNRQSEITRQYVDSILSAQKTELIAMFQKSQQIPLPIERNLTKWEKVKQETGGIAIGILVVVLISAVIWLVKKFKKK